MPICRRSYPRLCLALAPVMLSATALAQDRAAPGSADEKAQGDAAMERLKTAIAARQKHEPAGGATQPVLPAIQDNKARRAFEGLRKHAPSPAMEARAHAALDAGRAGLAASREAMAKRVAQALGLEAPDRAALEGAIAPTGPRAYVPVLFASSSMPLSQLRAYAVQLEPVGGVIAFRGMVGGMGRVGPMAKLIAQALRLDPGCEGPACAMRKVQVIVDPLIFRQHDVRQVPALTLIPGDPTRPYCEREEDSERGAHLVYGDASLSALLDEYARLGGKEGVRDVTTRLQRR
nr:type-F conjugative transfer system pilin assembly protein TrbC [Novosphingobium sediminicola]